MLSAKWTSSGAVAAALSAFLVFGSGAALTAGAQDAGPVSQLSARDSYLVLEHRAADQMTADDAGILRARQKDLTFEAAMFGYDLTIGHWTYDQTICPDIPQALVLHYRITGRSGQGIENMNLARRKDAVVAAFPVGARDQIIVITNTGMVMRMPVEGVSIKRRRSQGVVVFKVGEGERVVSVAHLAEAGENGAGDEDEGETAAPEAPP